MSKNLKLKKVIKSFVPEPRKSSSVSSDFGFLYAYEHSVFMNICERFRYKYEYVYFTYPYHGYVTLEVSEFGIQLH